MPGPAVLPGYPEAPIPPILGGDVGGNMSGLTDIFEEKLREYNNFDYDTSYIQLGKYRSGSAAIGAARLMGTQYIVNLRF